MRFFDNLFKRKPRGAQAPRSQPISYGGPLPTVTPLEFIELKTNATDPNKAKWWALGLGLAGIIVALLTIRSNYAYFRHYYDGFDFDVRIIVGGTLEAMIIAWALIKGWGNHKQMKVAIWFEVVLIATALFHTSQVGQSEQARKIAQATKTEAVADYSTGKSARDEAIAENDRLRRTYQDDRRKYQQDLAVFRQSARAYNSMGLTARDNGQRLGAAPEPPKPPTEPKYVDVPAIKDSVVANTQINVAETTEKAVNHKLLNYLLYLMAFESVASLTAMALLADSSRLRAWLMKLRGQELDAAMKNTPIGISAPAQSHSYGAPTYAPYPNPHANPIGFTYAPGPAPAASSEPPPDPRGKA
jgi:hypothetical protein